MSTPPLRNKPSHGSATYASSFNTKAINSHMFFVLVYVKKHNMLMRATT